MQQVSNCIKRMKGVASKFLPLFLTNKSWEGADSFTSFPLGFQVWKCTKFSLFPPPTLNAAGLETKKMHATSPLLSTVSWFEKEKKEMEAKSLPLSLGCKTTERQKNVSWMGFVSWSTFACHFGQKSMSVTSVALHAQEKYFIFYGSYISTLLHYYPPQFLFWLILISIKVDHTTI